MTSSVNPLVILGDSITGRGADDTNQAFRKYNQHTHQTVLAPNFLLYGLSLGDAVYVYDANDQSVFNLILPPTITYLSATELRISTTAGFTLAATDLYISAPKEDSANGIVIPAVNVTYASNLITFNLDVPRAGFINPTQLESLASYQISATTQIAASGIFPVIASLPTVSWVKSAALSLTQGSGVFYLKQTVGNLTTTLGDSIVISAASGVGYFDLTELTVNDDLVTYPTKLSRAPLPVESSISVVASGVYLPSGVSSTSLLTAINLTRVTL